LSILFLFGCIRGIYSPCFNSLRPFVVPEHLYTNAATWTSMCWQACGILAPVVGCWRIWIWILLLASSWHFFYGQYCPLVFAKRDFPQIQTESVTQSLKDALQFIFKTKIIFWAMFLDLGSVFFGGIIALLPIFAQDILHVGADGFGLLRAAPAFGGLVMMLILVRYPPKSDRGR
jgi:hypothetical protein